MPKQRCQDMLEDLLYEAIDAGAQNRNVNPHHIGRFLSTCVRSNAAGLGRRQKRRRARRRSRR